MTIRRRLAFVIDRSLLLVAGAVVALVWANTLPDSHRAFSAAAFGLVNDVGMVFFFGLAAKEIVEATRPGGACVTARGRGAVVRGRRRDDRPGRPLRRGRAGAGRPGAAAWLGDSSDRHRSHWSHGSSSRRSIRRSRFAAAGRRGRCAGAWRSSRSSIRRTSVAAAVRRADGGGPRDRLVAAPAGHPEFLAVRPRRRNVVVGGPVRRGPASGARAGADRAVHAVRRAAQHDLFEHETADASDTLDSFADWWRVPVQIVLFFFGLANAGAPLSEVGASRGW